MPDIASPPAGSAVKNCTTGGQNVREVISRGARPPRHAAPFLETSCEDLRDQRAEGKPRADAGDQEP